MKILQKVITIIVDEWQILASVAIVWLLFGISYAVLILWFLSCLNYNFKVIYKQNEDLASEISKLNSGAVGVFECQHCFKKTHSKLIKSEGATILVCQECGGYSNLTCQKN